MKDNTVRRYNKGKFLGKVFYKFKNLKIKNILIYINMNNDWLKKIKREALLNVMSLLQVIIVKEL